MLEAECAQQSAEHEGEQRGSGRERANGFGLENVAAVWQQRSESKEGRPVWWVGSSGSSARNLNCDQQLLESPRAAEEWWVEE